jgi:hypothetical protein
VTAHKFAEMLLTGPDLELTVFDMMVKNPELKEREGVIVRDEDGPYIVFLDCPDNPEWLASHYENFPKTKVLNITH